MKAFISISAPTLLCQTRVGNCQNNLCECLESESYGKYAGTEGRESKGSFGEISFQEEKEEEVEIVANEPREKLSLWRTILEECRREREELKEWENEQQESRSEKTSCEAVEYLDKEIFQVLLPAMEKMMREIRKWNTLEAPKYLFNALDYLAEYLWNKNPKNPGRQLNWIKIFEIPPFRLWLQSNPRPIYPKSWVWTRDEAVLIIQRNIRGWLVRKRRDVQELREFWKTLAAERAETGSLISSVNLSETKDPHDKFPISINKKIREENKFPLGDYEILPSMNEKPFDICKIFNE